jgi:alpha-tubulin suppressor-like RCC1 family protein
MKPQLRKSVLLCLSFILSSVYLFAQCNVNDKYDKIISGYHSSIALKDNGTYAVWGSDMKNAGNADQLAPQDISVANYPTLTGTVHKAAMGGKNAGAQVDQAFVLTSDGLWAWGVAGNVVSTGVKSGNTFGRTSTTSANGFNTYGLPASVTPTDVASLFATYQTLVLLTTSGNVWVLTQTTLAVEGNGGTVTSAGTSTWKQVKINASTNLTNVTAVRGQVSNATYNAFIALTSTGEVYTWGNTTYLGDGSAATARNYATQMSFANTEFSSSMIPKMIGVTGGIGTTTTTKNTYYLLSNTGNLYTLGDNTQRQCGDFTTTERTSWVKVKKSAAANDYLTNINFFSCQEHNSSYPAAAAITTTGGLYTWGNNSSGMVGRTDNGTITGGLTTQSFDPGMPVDFTGTAISVEMGGHTMVYLKEGSTQFCYVGHYTNGSMGDGTSGSNGTSTATSLKHDCNSTPSLNICGSVPVSASPTTSTISTSLSAIPADGSSVSVITIQLKDASGVNLTSSGGIVTVTTSAGTMGTVIDNNNGTYTVVLTSAASVGTATIGFAVNGTTSSHTVQVQFTTVLAVNWLEVRAYRQNKTVKLTWKTINELNVKNYAVERSTNGVNWETIINNIPAVNSSGTTTYQQVDNNFNPGQIFYRIKQIDLSGHFTYSSIQVVYAIATSERITVYPVPAQNVFHLGNISPVQIRQVQLLTVNGTVAKSWTSIKPDFDITELPAGIYIVRIEKIDGTTEILRLTKQQ